MSNIGIVTITSARNNVFNYGNVLQNYALTKFIKNEGHKATTIYYNSYIPDFSKKFFKNEKVERGFLQFVSDVFRVGKRNLFRNKISNKAFERNRKFLEFINKNIIYTETFDRNSSCEKLNETFDFFIVGSDQVWNPFYEGSNEFFYLPFADRNKRLTYAPSIGVDYIPNEMKKKMSLWLRNFDKITIREKSGKRILKETFGINANIVCDPVFLLDKSNWLKSAAPMNKRSKYFVVYILGKKTLETKRSIKKLEILSGATAVDVYTKDDYNSLFCGPDEFLTLLNESDFIVTDSFHATSFSLILEKPLVLLDRNAANKNSNYKMNSRIDDILKMVRLENRNCDDILYGKSKLYDTIKIEDTILFELIEQSKNYLRNIIVD